LKKSDDDDEKESEIEKHQEEKVNWGFW